MSERVRRHVPPPCSALRRRRQSACSSRAALRSPPTETVDLLSSVTSCWRARCRTWPRRRGRGGDIVAAAAVAVAQCVCLCVPSSCVPTTRSGMSAPRDGSRDAPHTLRPEAPRDAATRDRQRAPRRGARAFRRARLDGVDLRVAPVIEPAGEHRRDVHAERAMHARALDRRKPEAHDRDNIDRSDRSE